MNKKRASIRDVAEHAGVSIGAASNALNPETSGKVSSALRDRVIAAARELGYQRRPRAPRNRPVIAVCGNYDNPDPLSPFNGEVVLGLLRGAAEASVDLLFLSDLPLPERRRSADYYLERTFDALLAYGVPPEHEDVLAAVGEVRGVVTLFAALSADTVACVDGDNAGIGRLAAKELLSRGYDRYVHIADSGRNAFSLARKEAFEAAIPPDSLDPAIEFAPGVRPWGPESDEPAARDVQELLEKRPSKSIGVFAWSDAVAIHMIRANILEIPARVGLLGCDGLELAEPWLELAGLSTISQGVAEIARRGVWLAVRMTEGKARNNERIIADDLPRVITRESTTVVRP